jgi:hypothetical protein
MRRGPPESPYKIIHYQSLMSPARARPHLTRVHSSPDLSRAHHARFDALWQMFVYLVCLGAPLVFVDVERDLHQLVADFRSCVVGLAPASGYSLRLLDLQFRVKTSGPYEFREFDHRRQLDQGDVVVLLRVSVSGVYNYVSNVVVCVDRAVVVSSQVKVSQTNHLWCVPEIVLMMREGSTDQTNFTHLL